MNPLDQLADITLPSDVSMWPLAWGYWAVTGLLLMLLVWATIGALKYRKRRQLKRSALKTLSTLDKQSPYYAQHVQVLLKQLCSGYIPQQPSGPLFGKQWHHMIMSIYVGNNPTALSSALSGIFNNIYTRQQANDLPTNAEFEAPISDWIKTSLPPKPSVLEQLNVTKEATHV